jgi:sensor histidine kinase YesM
MESTADMNEMRRTEFIGLSLAHAGQLAYAEEAAGTCELLHHLNLFFRYVSNGKERVLLKNEIDAAASFIAIMKISNPLSIAVDFHYEPHLEESLVPRFVLIDLLDGYLTGRATSDDSCIEVIISLSRKECSILCSIFTSGSKVPVMERVFS